MKSAVINKAINLTLLFLIGAYLIVPQGARFIEAFTNNSTPYISGVTSTVATGIVLILIIVFIFRQVQNERGK